MKIKFYNRLNDYIKPKDNLKEIMYFASEDDEIYICFGLYRGYAYSTYIPVIESNYKSLCIENLIKILIRKIGLSEFLSTKPVSKRPFNLRGIKDSRPFNRDEEALLKHFIAYYGKLN